MIGHSTITRGAEAPAEAAEKIGPVKIWGEAEDAIQVTGDVEGCQAYNVTEARFRFIGENGSVVVGLRYWDVPKLWLWTAEADPSGFSLPLEIRYEPTTAIITVDNVKQVVKI